MGKKPLAKMPIRDRAKQFMPFAALKGFEEAIRFSETMAQYRVDGEYDDDYDNEDKYVSKLDDVAMEGRNK